MLKRNIKLVFSTNALMLCSGVVTSLLSAWALGPAGRGDLIIVLMWPAIFSMVAQFGLPSAYRFWTAKRPDYVSALFSNALIFTLVMGVITLGVAELMIPLLIGHRSEEVVRLARIYLLVIPILMLTDLLRGLLEGARRFTWVGVLRLVLFGVQLGSFIILWLVGRLTVPSATYTMVAAVVASLLLSFLAVWRELHPHWRPKLSDLGTTLRYGIRDYPGVLTEFVNWRLDLMMLVGMASSSAVGLYAVALRLADITSTLASSVGDALMPEVAAAENADAATRVVTRSLRLTLAAHLSILVPLWVAVPFILRFAYGEPFLPVTNVLRLLMVASVVWSAGAIVISGLNGLGHPGLSAIARMSAALVMVVALRIWLPSRGIQGAALSSIVGYSVMFLVALFWLLRRRQITLWECLRPRWGDIPHGFMPASLRGRFSAPTARPTPPQTGEALIMAAEHTARKKDDVSQGAATPSRESQATVTWKLLTDEAAREIWDEALLRLDDYTPFQSYAWGEYRRALGWEPCRWAAFDERGKIVAMMLGQLRRYLLGFGLMWTEGGPVGDLSVCGDSLQQAIHQYTGVKRLYIRFRCDRPRQIEDVLRLNSLGWDRSWFNLTTNFSMSLDLNREEDRLLAACDRNWRRNLRRANESKLSLRQWIDPDAAEVLAVYASMQKLKGLEEQLSLEEIEQLLKHFKEQLVLYRCDDESGEVVSLLGWVVLGKRAWAVLWATSESGRKLQASHAIFWALVQHCLKLKVESCDLAGIDPVQNHGVYRFKRDTGAVPLEYLGEWDWGSRPWMRWLGNWAIARRSRIKQAEAALKKSRPAQIDSTVNVASGDPVASPEFPGTHLRAAAGKL